MLIKNKIQFIKINYYSILDTIKCIILYIITNV